MTDYSQIQIHSVVQLNPDTVVDREFAGCFLVVTNIKSWGVVGYVQVLGKRDEPGGQTYYRAGWDEVAYVGNAMWRGPLA
jgi:hypothetical protein